MGEGISCGMESGFQVANAIIDNLTSPQNVLTAYQQNATDLVSYMRSQWNLVSIMSSKVKNMAIKSRGDPSTTLRVTNNTSSVLRTASPQGEAKKTDIGDYR